MKYNKKTYENIPKKEEEKNIFFNKKLKICSNDIYEYNLDLYNSINVIIIDEGQDMNKDNFNIVKVISTKRKIPIIIAGDINQSIYGFRGADAKLMQSHSKIVFSLDINYRSSQSIINFCDIFRTYNNDFKILSHDSRIGEKPKLYKYSMSKQSIFRYIIDKIISKYYNDDTKIAFLVNNNNILMEFKNLLGEYKNVITQTICRSKGLEYDIVILFDFTDKSYFKDFDHVSDCNNWYVGASRAKEKLFIFHEEYSTQYRRSRSLPENMYGADNNLYETIQLN